MRIVFITMLAVKDADHVVRADVSKLAKLANKTQKETDDALKVLEAPDKRKPFNRDQQDNEGRRIKWVKDGWLILNGEKYQSMIAKEYRRVYKREWQANKRAEERAAKQPLVKRGKPVTGEGVYLRAEASGADEAELARVTEGCLPGEGVE